MTTRQIWRWLGIAAQLYVAFALIFFAFNISTIFVIRGTAPLTADVVAYIFARDALIAVPLAALGCVFMAYFMRSLRRTLSRSQR